MFYYLFNIIKIIFICVIWVINPKSIFRVFVSHLVGILLIILILHFKRLLRPIWRIYMMHMLFSRNRIINYILREILRINIEKEIKKIKLKTKLKKANSYEKWEKIAFKLDLLEGGLIWKKEIKSNYYDYTRISYDIHNLKTLMKENNTMAIKDYLRARLKRNVGGMCNGSLQNKLRVGTKELIEQYISVVIEAINFISNKNIPGMSVVNKYQYFSLIKHSYGNSALLLSGGGALGIYHAGIIRALIEKKLLPRIISGSSVGAIIASIIGCKTIDELTKMIDESDFNFNFFPPSKNSFFRKLKRLFNEGVLMDIKILQACLRANIGDITFEEAYNRTGIILNITVSLPSKSNNYIMPRLLNYLSTPNVLLWSAACASCAIPFVYKPVELKEKTKNGIHPYYLKGLKFSDGSFLHDLPIRRLSELFNVNHFIVSQTNPFVLLFMQSFAGKKNLIYLKKLMKYFGNQCIFTLLSLWDLGVINRFHLLRNIMYQKYEGDITFIAPVKLNEFSELLKNPSKEKFTRVAAISRHKAWPILSGVQTNCSIEYKLGECVLMFEKLMKESDIKNNK